MHKVYVIAYAILNSKENLRSDNITKEGKISTFYLFSAGYFINENIFSVFSSSSRNTCGSLGELETVVETLT